MFKSYYRSERRRKQREFRFQQGRFVQRYKPVSGAKVLALLCSEFCAKN